ncbi:hypothetical protein ACFPIJ_42695 [Dactylosporangium cerinum]|uniref:Serine/threonine protein kinase n=1 Tax=Dactylosporangium cerinum TaxID=1434730 RepID=A0ABV9W8D0_9ACTN
MICGAPGFTTGDGHLCPEHGGRPPMTVARPRPPLGWQVLTWLFVAVTLGYLSLLVLNIVALAAVISTSASGTVFDLTALLSSVTLVWIWVYVGAFLCWSVSSRRTVQRLGYERDEILRHWTYTVWRLSLVLVIVFSLFVGSRPQPDADAFVRHGYALMGYTALRIAMVTLLSAYVILVWRRLTRTPGPTAPRESLLVGGVLGAGLAGLLVLAVVTLAVTVPATVPHASGASLPPSVAASPSAGPSQVRPRATLRAPAAIAEYARQSNQSPATAMRTAHPLPGVEVPFTAYYRDPAGHTIAIWGGTGQAYDKAFNADALDTVLAALGPLGGAPLDHFRLAQDGLSRGARCTQFTTTDQHGTACVWAGNGAVLALVFTALDAPATADLMWRALGGIVVV